MINSKVFFIGIGGVGMSALAQLYRHLGYQIVGSDRNISNQDELFHKLRLQGIQICQQDASGLDESFSLVVYSNAIEEDNIEFIKAKQLNIKMLHRAEALADALKSLDIIKIAIAGSSGKSTTCAWLCQTLNYMGVSCMMINGAYAYNFMTELLPGNFVSGTEVVVYEACESDGSLVNYTNDFAIVLNLSLDHYSEEELIELFGKFLQKSKTRIANFSLQENYQLDYSFNLNSSKADFFAKDIQLSSNSSHFTLPYDNTKYKINLLGMYSVDNAVAVLTILHALNLNQVKFYDALLSYKGIKRRFQYKGINSNGNIIYDDYAHNIAKIKASVLCASSVSDKNIIIVFQPHGFAPFGMMYKKLQQTLADILNDRHIFCLLDVYYAGGNTSFSPTSMEVASYYEQDDFNCKYFASRNSFEEFLQTRNENVVLVLGARDPSLEEWTENLALL